MGLRWQQVFFSSWTVDHFVSRRNDNVNPSDDDSIYIVLAMKISSNFYLVCRCIQDRINFDLIIDICVIIFPSNPYRFRQYRMRTINPHNWKLSCIHIVCHSHQYRTNNFFFMIGNYLVFCRPYIRFSLLCHFPFR